MEIEVKLASGYYTLKIHDNGNTMDLSLLDQKEANEMAKKFRDAADYLYEQADAS